ncbi:hypothetical protein V6N11_056094 [Hibiscus sabdariffa]|uniref:Uncharacterized protein n=1 Tax=Hibiscus sabdariffa TaxID=183260 RepID=A0ABR2T3H7_9ROSI
MERVLRMEVAMGVVRIAYLMMVNEGSMDGIGSEGAVFGWWKREQAMVVEVDAGWMKALVSVRMGNENEDGYRGKGACSLVLWLLVEGWWVAGSSMGLLGYEGAAVSSMLGWGFENGGSEVPWLADKDMGAELVIAWILEGGHTWFR